MKTDKQKPKIKDMRNINIKDYYKDGKLDVHALMDVFPQPTVCEKKDGRRKRR